MSDIDERLARIEQTHDQQRQRWIAAAAKNTGFHDPRDALLLVDPATVVTPPDADRAVAALAQERPYLAVERITEEEQHRRWGQELLDRIDRA